MKSLRKKKISILLALTMVISTFIGVTPATTWATQPVVLFEDMFQNPLTTSSALSINKGTWGKEWTLKANPTNSEKNALFYNRVDTEGYILTGEQDWSNYVVETKVYMPTGDSWINLRGYVQENVSKYYQIGYNPSAQTIRLEVVTASGTTTLESYSKQLRANQWYVFKIAFNDGTINCYLDGEKIISVVDTTYTSGKTGLRSNWGSMYVSEYSVKGIPENNEALSCIAKAASSITLDWSDIAGATSYTLYRAENNDNDYIEVYSGAVSNYEDTSVTQGTPYYYKMTYTNEEESQYSSSLRVIPSDASYVIRLDETAYSLSIGKTHTTKVTRENEDTSVEDVTTEARYASSDVNIATVDAQGIVTAVAVGTAKITVTYDSKNYEVNVTVTVKKAANSVEIVALDKEAITLYNLEDLRGNMTLPTIGENGSTISWACSPALITPTGEVTRPSYGEGDKTVTLTATITHEAASTTREFSATIREVPKQENLEGYLFTYFIGDGARQEQMSFALSEGNTPLKWNTMNEGNPVLIAELGEKGLRAPSIIRSPEGDKFYLIATDLQIATGKGWGAAQKDGSKCIFVWESTDLVNWSKQRLVQVSSDLAGCTWAPEIIYDEDKGEYVVYWASKIYADESKSGNPHHRIMYATTRDFYTFSPAKEYFNPGYAVIDTVMIKNNGKVYRFTKDERDNGTGSGQSQEGKMIFQEVGSSIFANDFRRTTNDFVKAGVKWVEGPLTFKDNLEEKWYLFVDDFGGEGYIPFYTDNLDTGTWTKVAVSDKKMPSPKPRHGTILPITASEYARLQAHIPVEAPVSIELVTGVSLPTTLSTQLGQITSLQAIVTPASAANKEVTFESSDPTVVTVKDGELSCLALGKAIITAKTKDGGYTAACTVTVNEATNVPVPVTNVTLNETQLEVKVGKERQLVATVVPDHATLKVVKWESSDPSIATVDENGKVTAVALGSALITATSINGNKMAICNISVVAQGNGVLYNFDENAGAIAKDSLENKEDAQLKGGVSWTEGLANGAVKLNGNNGYIALPDDVIKGLSEMTIQMWVNQQEDKRWSRILDFGTGSGDNLFLSGYGSPGGGRNAIGLHLVVGDTEDTVYSADNFRLTNNEWTHLAVTFEGTTCTIYMNGEEIAKNTGMRVNPSGLKNSMNYIGKSKYGADPYFKGVIDEFSVQDKALTGAEIKEGIKQYLNEPEEVTIQSLQEQVSISTQVGQAPILPAQVEATYSDGSKAMVNVRWDSIAFSQYAQVGKFTVEGTVAGTTLRATAEVVVNAATSGDSGSGSGSGSSSSSTISVSKAEQAINKLSEIAKEEVKQHIQSVKEKIPYTSLNTAMTVQQLDELTKGKFKKEELEEMLKKPGLLEKLGMAKDLLPKVVVLEPIKDARFIDVNATHWANNYIKQAAEMGLVAGNPDGSFAPKHRLTQGDTFTFLDRVLLNKGIVEMKLPRTVVEKHVTNKESWLFPYVASIGSKLSEATLVETCAYTEKGLTRELLAQVLYELTNGKLEVVRIPIAFQDVENSPYKEAIDYCTSVDLLLGTSETTMEPHRALTRAEMMTVIIKLNELLPVQK